MTAITDAAKEALASGTGFESPRVVGVAMSGGLYHVIVDITDRKDGKSGVLRTYDVAVDAEGGLHGYAPLASGKSVE